MNTVRVHEPGQLPVQPEDVAERIEIRRQCSCADKDLYCPDWGMDKDDKTKMAVAAVFPDSMSYLCRWHGHCAFSEHLQKDGLHITDDRVIMELGWGLRLVERALTAEDAEIRLGIWVSHWYFVSNEGLPSN